jgi:hypothetical protein
MSRRSFDCRENRRVGRIEEFAEPGAGDFIATFNAAEVA